MAATTPRSRCAGWPRPAPRTPARPRPAWPRGLLGAAPAFDFRLPELYGGESAGGGRRPLAYPAACRPQAWSAAAALVVLIATLGLTPDVPAGRVTLRPMRPSPVGELTVRGLRVAGQPLDVRLTAAGDPEILPPHPASPSTSADRPDALRPPG